VIVSIGQQVVGKNGILGMLSGLRIDSKSQTAEEMVIRHGFPMHDYRLAVLGFVTGVQDGTVEVDLDRAQLGELERYNPAAYRSLDFDRKAPGVLDQGSNERWNYGMDEVLSNSPSDKPQDRPVEETHAMPPHYPAGEEIAPEEDRPIIVSQETLVWDSQGRKVGQVQTLAVETSTGRPERLTLKRGFLSQPGLVIPLEWVQQYGPKGIALRVANEKVEELLKSGK
jgi:sporulation protein YlmC with PRC-barrel domain